MRLVLKVVMQNDWDFVDIILLQCRLARYQLASTTIWPDQKCSYHLRRISFQERGIDSHYKAEFV